ncbi:MAG: hypothetical protein IJM59_08935 [Proteobacteria bacterium]|nr:hypothetical protein [Pseudomonadota bacterium]
MIMNSKHPARIFPISLILTCLAFSGCGDDSGSSEQPSACDEATKPNDACTCSEDTKVWECQTTPACTGEKPNPDCTCKSDGTWECPPANTECKEAKPNDSCTCNEDTGKWENCETTATTKCDEAAKSNDSCTCNEGTGEWENCGSTTTTNCDEAAKSNDSCTCNEDTGEWENCSGTNTKCDEAAKTDDACTCNEETGEWENCNPDCQNDCSEEGEKKCGEDNDILECTRDDAGCLKWNVNETCSEGSHCAESTYTCEATAVEQNVFKAGFSRVNITPTLSLPLAGYGNTQFRMSQGYLDPLYANCVAMTDENGAAVLLIMVDLIGGRSEFVTDSKKAISKATGIPVDNIFIQGSHTHSAPDMGYATYKEENYSKYTTEQLKAIIGIKYYKERLVEALTQAASEALADRKPATLKAGNIEVDGLNFVRHYLLDNDTYAGPNFGDFSSGSIVGHESEADHTLQILQFERKDAKDILLLNFQVHVTRTGGRTKTDISADIVGQIRNNVENKLDVWCTYLQGASGNINPTSMIPEENRTTDYKEYGVLFSEIVVDCYNKNMSPIQPGYIKTSKQTYTAKVNFSENDKVCAALKIKDDWTDNGVVDDSYKGTSIAKAYQEKCGKSYSFEKIAKDCDSNYQLEGEFTNSKLMKICDIHSPYHARSIVSKYDKYINDDKESKFTISTLGVGDIGLACAPFELFDNNADDVKSESTKSGVPFKMTLIMGYCNGYLGYLPSDISYTHTCYEADTCLYEQGTAEKVADTFINMLKNYTNTAETIKYTAKPVTTQPAKVSKKVYWNIDFDTYHVGTTKNRTETSGKYNINMTAQDGSAVTKTFASKEVAADFDKFQLGSIGEKDGVVTEVGSVEDAGYVLGCDNYWVESYDKNSVTLNSSPVYEGVEKTFKITAKTKRILVPAAGKKEAKVMDRFRNHDRVWIVSDKDNNAIAAFITERVANTDEEEAKYPSPVTSKCQHCGKVVKWKDWYDETSLPLKSGHYRLVRDGELSGQMSIEKDAEICLDLNGHTYLGKENTRMYSLHNSGVVLALMDNSAKHNGTLKARGTQMSALGPVVWARYGKAYFYNGIYDASAVENTSSGNALMINEGAQAFIKGGTFKGGTSKYNSVSGSGGIGGTIAISGECTIDDGVFQGGNATTSVSDKNGYGGIVNVASAGKLTIHGGKFSGGKSTRLGGCVSVFGNMTMSGGEISGCDSKTGKVLYVGSTGHAKITGGHVDGAVGGSDGKVYVYGTGKLECDAKYCY